MFCNSYHCLKSVQIRSFFWSVFSRIFPHTPYLSVFSPNAGKYGPEKTPYLDTFHAVYHNKILPCDVRATMNSVIVLIIFYVDNFQTLYYCCRIFVDIFCNRVDISTNLIHFFSSCRQFIQPWQVSFLNLIFPWMI